MRRINHTALINDRSQLLAEAIELYHRGAQWWPDAAFEQKHIMPEQSKRYEADAWEDEIRKHLKGKRGVTIMQIARDALDISTEPSRDRSSAPHRICLGTPRLAARETHRTRSPGQTG